jgi:carboxymethylenebutenolidase
VNTLAVNAPDLAAGVAYYGAQPNPDVVPQIQAPLLLHYAGEDARINAGIEAYKAALEAASKEFTIHMYEGAQHAFNNDTSEARYNKEAADLAWGRTVAFFKEKLAA